jgi:hypothetical protein
MLKALTTQPSGNMHYTVLPPESVLAIVSTGGTPFEKSNGFVKHL